MDAPTTREREPVEVVDLSEISDLLDSLLSTTDLVLRARRAQAVLRRAELLLHRHGSVMTVRDDAIRALNDSGLSKSAIARALGMSHQRIGQITNVI